MRHLETVDQHQSRSLLLDEACEHHDRVLTDLPELSLVLDFFPWEDLHQARMVVLARLHSLEYFLGHENVRIVEVFPILNVERHGDRVLGIRALHPCYHDPVPEGPEPAT